MTKICWEDFPVGRVDEFGNRKVTEEEIVEFATDFDPQFFHVDKEAAEKHFFGGLIASGWHTGAMLMRMIVDALLTNSTSIGSPGIDELRWMQPVRPGDVLKVRSEVVASTPHKHKSDRGFTKFRHTVLDQEDQVKMVMVSTIIFLRRSKGENNG